PELVRVVQGNLLIGQRIPGVELVGNLHLALHCPDDGDVAVEVAGGDQGRNLAVQVLTRPLVEGVKELLGQIDGGLPLLEVLELEGLAGAGLEHQRDIIGVDRAGRELAIVDGRQRAHVGKVDVDRLTDPRGLRLDVLVDGVQEGGLADLRLVVLVRARNERLEECSEIVSHDGLLKRPGAGWPVAGRRIEKEQLGGGKEQDRMDPDPYSSPDQRWGGPSVSATLLRDVMLMLGRDMYQLRSEVCHVLRVYLNRPSRAASPMSCLFRGSSMNFGSARISAVTMVPSPPWLRADRPPPAGAGVLLSSSPDRALAISAALAAAGSVLAGSKA